MNIADIIKVIARDGGEFYHKICTVDSVDEDARTVDCTPIDEGAPLIGVNLQANQGNDCGVVLFPAVNSYVLVGFLSPAVAVVLLADEIDKAEVTIGDNKAVMDSDGVELTTKKVTATVTEDKVSIDADGTTLELEKNKTTFNGGSETMANANDLKQQLGTMSGRIDAIINAFSSAGVAPMDGGATFKASLIATLAPHLANKENFANIVDDKIKH
ncbi:MAG: hypothetical protein IJR34_07650 [Bacteroidales bacterium]|nr:hypothetical protein [Bacteroidales bacterium]